METAALCKPIQRFADLLRIPDTWVLTGLGKLLAALGSFPHFPQPLRLLHTHLYWRFLECQSIEVTLTQNGHLTHHEIPSVASLRPGGHFPPDWVAGFTGIRTMNDSFRKDGRRTEPINHPKRVAREDDDFCCVDCLMGLPDLRSVRTPPITYSTGSRRRLVAWLRRPPLRRGAPSTWLFSAGSASVLRRLPTPWLSRR